MKTAISVPDSVFTQADRLARDLHMSRSALYTCAMEEYIRERRHSRVREALDEVYAAESSAIDPGLLGAQVASLPGEEW